MGDDSPESSQMSTLLGAKRRHFKNSQDMNSVQPLFTPRCLSLSGFKYHIEHTRNSHYDCNDP